MQKKKIVRRYTKLVMRIRNEKSPGEGKLPEIWGLEDDIELSLLYEMETRSIFS